MKNSNTLANLVFETFYRTQGLRVPTGQISSTLKLQSVAILVDVPRLYFTTPAACPPCAFSRKKNSSLAFLPTENATRRKTRTHPTFLPYRARDPFREARSHISTICLTVPSVPPPQTWAKDDEEAGVAQTPPSAGSATLASPNDPRRAASSFYSFLTTECEKVAQIRLPLIVGGPLATQNSREKRFWRLGR